MVPARIAGVLLFAASFAISGSAAAEKISIEDLIQNVRANGTEGRVPGPIADLVGLPKEAPYSGLAIAPKQATDGRLHGFRVVGGTQDKTLALLLNTSHERSSDRENYWYLASLAGVLEKTVVIQGKLDKSGKSIKGSGVTSERDSASPEIQKRFRRELELWLERKHLKKAWRSAEFSGGELRKKDAR